MPILDNMIAQQARGDLPQGGFLSRIGPSLTALGAGIAGGDTLGEGLSRGFSLAGRLQQRQKVLDAKNAAAQQEQANSDRDFNLRKRIFKAKAPPLTFEQKLQLRRAGKPETNVNITNKGQGEFVKGLGKGSATAFLEQRAKAQDSIAIIRTNQEARRLLDAGMITGFGANFLTTFGEGLQQIGVNKFDDKIANTRAFAAALGSNVGRVIKQFGAGTGLSDADRDFAEQMAGGKIKLTEGAIRRILDINDRAARFAVQRFNKRANQIQTRFPGAIGIPLTVDEGTGFVNQPGQSGRITIDINGNPVR